MKAALKPKNTRQQSDRSVPGLQAAEKAGNVPSTATAAMKESAGKTAPNPEAASSSSKQAIAERESELEAEMESWEAMEEAAETSMAGNHSLLSLSCWFAMLHFSVPSTCRC